MKVSELIEKLKEFPPDSTVQYYDGDNAGYGEVESVELSNLHGGFVELSQ